MLLSDSLFLEKNDEYYSWFLLSITYQQFTLICLGKEYMFQ